LSLAAVQRDLGRAVAAEGLLRDELEGVDVIRSDDSEVTMVERRDRGRAETLGCRNHGRVYGAERKVGVGLDELGRSTEIGDLERLEDDSALSELAKQPSLGAAPAILPTRYAISATTS